MAKDSLLSPQAAPLGCLTGPARFTRLTPALEQPKGHLLKLTGAKLEIKFYFFQEDIYYIKRDKPTEINSRIPTEAQTSACRREAEATRALGQVHLTQTQLLCCKMAQEHKNTHLLGALCVFNEW